MAHKFLKVYAVLLILSPTAIAQSPNEITPLLKRGEALMRAGELDQARSLFTSALDRFQANPDLSFDLGMTCFLQHDWLKAIENYKISLKAQPDRVEALYYLAQAYYQTSNLTLARDTIAHAAALVPGNPDVCQEYGEYLAESRETRGQGLHWLQKAHDLNPNLERIDFDLGLTKFNLNDHQGAIVSFQTALEKNPENGEASFFLAESRSALGDWQKAHENYNYAIAHGYTQAPAYYGLGRALVELGNDNAAIPSLKHALALQPTLAEVHFQLASAYRHLGQSEEAKQEAMLYRQLKSDSADSVSTRPPAAGEEMQARVYVKGLLDAGKEQEALDYLATMRSRSNAESLDPYLLVAILYRSGGRNEDARRILAMGRQREPQNAQIPSFLGAVLLSLGQPSAAESSFNDALALDPANEFALIGLAQIRYTQQRWEDVIRYLERSHTANPGALYLLCDGYFRIGKTSAAMRTAETIRGLAANDQNLLNDLNHLVSLHTAAPNSPAPH